jgi:hypothetical protein
VVDGGLLERVKDKMLENIPSPNPLDLYVCQRFDARNL